MNKSFSWVFKYSRIFKEIRLSKYFDNSNKVFDKLERKILFISIPKLIFIVLTNINFINDKNIINWSLEYMPTLFENCKIFEDRGLFSLNISNKWSKVSLIFSECNSIANPGDPLERSYRNYMYIRLFHI